MAIKQQLTDLNSAVSNLTQKSLQFVICQPAQGTTSKPLFATAVSSSADREYSLSSKQSSVIPQGAVEMARDVNLKVAGFQSIMTPANRTDRNTSERNKQRNPAVVGYKQPLNNSSNQLKASGRPKEFHLYVSKLDLLSTMEQIRTI